MRDKTLRRALVTGAASGIGQAAVRALSASDREVLAVARRGDRLRELADETGCACVACDVRDLERIAPAIEEFKPDIVVNNAGVGHGLTGLRDIGPQDVRAAVETNILAPIQITACALVGMKQREYGHIVNIGSIAGLHTMISALYGATKSAVHVFSQNLRMELAGTRIRVSEICPGRVWSEFYRAAAGDAAALEKMGTAAIRALRPEDIAAAIMFAVDAPAHVNISTMEILPTEQIVGGVRMAPVEWKDGAGA